MSQFSVKFYLNTVTTDAVSMCYLQIVDKHKSHTSLFSPNLYYVVNILTHIESWHDLSKVGYGVGEVKLAAVVTVHSVSSTRSGRVSRGLLTTTP